MSRKTDLLSKTDADYILELIYSCVYCTNEETLSQMVNDLKHLIPHEFALCGFGSIDRESNEPYRLVNVSYPATWVETYVSEGLERCDPIVAENFRGNSIQYWADSFLKHRESKTFVSTAEDFGLKEGYSYGLRTYSGSMTSLFSFAGKAINRDARTELILEYIVPHLHQTFARIAVTGKDSSTHFGPQLSSREKEVLKWAKDGKSTWEISVILSISKDTVKFHVKNVMQKLQAVSRTQAVAAAIQYGLIHLE